MCNDISRSCSCSYSGCCCSHVGRILCVIRIYASCFCHIRSFKQSRSSLEYSVILLSSSVALILVSWRLNQVNSIFAETYSFAFSEFNTCWPESRLTSDFVPLHSIFCHQHFCRFLDKILSRIFVTLRYRDEFPIVEKPCAIIIANDASITIISNQRKTYT